MVGVGAPTVAGGGEAGDGGGVVDDGTRGGVVLGGAVLGVGTGALVVVELEEVVVAQPDGALTV